MPTAGFALLLLISATDPLTVADTAYQEFRYAEALPPYRAVMEQAPTTQSCARLLTAYVQLADTAPSHEDSISLLREATNAAARAVSLFPLSADLRARQAFVIGQLGRTEGGRARITALRESARLGREALALDPQDPMANALTGIVGYRLTQLTRIQKALLRTFGPETLTIPPLEDARQHLETAIAGDPHAVLYHAWHAKILTAMGSDTQARQAYQQALACPPRVASDLPLLNEARQALGITPLPESTPAHEHP